MSKFIRFYILFVFLTGPSFLFGQSRGDTPSTGYTDTLSVNNSDSVNSAESSDDSLYLPLADSSKLPGGKVREVSAKQVNLFKNDPEYAYANDPEYWRRETYREPGMFFRILFSSALRWTLLTIIAGLILFGIYNLAKENNFGLLVRNRTRKLSAAENEIPDESVDYDEAILRSQAEGNYSLAIRFMYLRLIRTLKEEHGISFKDSAPNAEIIRAMSNHPQLPTFRWLTTAYEYVFYGGFVPSRDLYERLKNKFELFQKTFPVEK